LSGTSQSFDILLMESVSEGLTEVLGEASAKCVTFYLDPHLAVADPNNYARSLLGLFGTATKAVLDAVLVRLYQKTGATVSPALSFGEIVVDLRRSYQQRLAPVEA
jgi:hypothetical protein